MDHLPKIRDPAFAFPPVPYYGYCGLIYSGPFSQFQDRMPRTKEGYQSWQHTYSNFFQEWLFFGLLQEIFKVWEIPFNRADFLKEEHGRSFVSTSNLCDYFVAAIIQEHKRIQSTRQRGARLETNDDIRNQGLDLAWFKYEPEIPRIREWLRQTHVLLVRAKCALEDDSLQVGDLDPNVWDSVILTAAALSHVTDYLYRWPCQNHEDLHYPVDFGKLHMRSITDLRISPLWCPNERRLIEELVDNSPQVIAFLSQLNLDEPEGFHVLCTRQECVAHHVREGYQTCHSTADCRCQTVEYNPDFRPAQASKDTQKWYQEFSKELTATTFEGGQLHSINIRVAKPKAPEWVKAPMNGRKFVAISHVWSDGLGNKSSNAMPSCQLARLQSLANSLYEDDQHPVPFWIDTLMIPVVPEEASDEQRHMKVEALRNMEWVYKGASKVLVLDSGLYTVDTSQMGAEEIGARIMCCTWSRRLWTLQEGCREGHTFFHFKDRNVSWPDLHHRVLQDTSASKWKDKHGKLPKGHPIRAMQKIPWVSRNRSPLNPGRGMEYGSVTFPLHQAKRELNKRLFRVVNSVWHSIHGFLEDMSLSWSGNGLKSGALGRCMRGMYYRNCTKKEDEALVLTSLLSANPGSAATIYRSAKEDRLRDVFLQLDTVPLELIFADVQRYDEPGTRWMPKSLLSANAPMAKPIRRFERLHHKSWRQGLAATGGALNCNLTRHGVAIGLDGLHIQPTLRRLYAPFRFQHEGTYFRVHLHRPGAASDISEREEGEWVVIPEKIFLAKPPECRGLLVKVLSNFPYRPGGQAEFSCLARLVRMTNEEWWSSTLPEIYFSIAQHIPTQLEAFAKQQLSSLEIFTDRRKVVREFLQNFFLLDEKWVVS